VTTEALKKALIAIPGQEDDLLPVEEDLNEVGRWEIYEHLLLRPGLSDAMLLALRNGRDMALVGPAGAGKSSLVMALARRKLGGFAYRRIAYDSLRPRATLKPHKKRVTVHLVDVPADGSLERLRASRAMRSLFIAECREEPRNHSPDFDILSVKWPDETEARRLLAETVARLRGEKRIVVEAGVLEEAVLLCRGTKSVPRYPWNAVRALWTAARRERERAASQGVRDLEKEIARLQREKDEAVSAQEFVLAAELWDKQVAVKKRKRTLLAADPAVLSLRPKRCVRPSPDLVCHEPESREGSRLAVGRGSHPGWSQEPRQADREGGHGRGATEAEERGHRGRDPS